MKAITAEKLSKTFAGGTVAVDGISFSLNKGEIFGFLGPNGAGKTTTVKLLCGMLTPSGGNCRVLGIDPVGKPEKLHQIIGVVTEHAGMYDHMTACENLQFYGALFGMSRPECKPRKTAFRPSGSDRCAESETCNLFYGYAAATFFSKSIASSSANSVSG